MIIEEYSENNVFFYKISLNDIQNENINKTRILSQVKVNANDLKDIKDINIRLGTMVIQTKTQIQL